MLAFIIVVAVAVSVLAGIFGYRNPGPHHHSNYDNRPVIDYKMIQTMDYYNSTRGFRISDPASQKCEHSERQR
jgi:hypothetical protein